MELKYESHNGVRVEVSPYNAIYIHDERGEIVMWNIDEVREEPEIFTAIANAVAIAFTHGGNALRRTINHPEGYDIDDDQWDEVADDDGYFWGELDMDSDPYDLDKPEF
jgi:hypothetical protein